MANNLNGKLFWAVERGYIDIVKEVISQGANVNCRNSDHNTPLHIAVNLVNVPMIKLLIDAGAMVNARGLFDITPLHEFFFQKQIDLYYVIVKLLLTRGADINLVTENNISALQLAARFGNINIVNFLLRHGASINVFDVKFAGVMHYACHNENFSLIRRMIEVGCDINHAPQSVLHFACYNCKSTELMQFLIKNGANPNAVNIVDVTPIFYLLYFEEASKSMRFMLKYSAVNNFQTVRGQNILNYRNSIYHWELIVEHIAKLQGLDRNILPELLETIETEKKYKCHFENCVIELKRAKNTIPPECSISFFHFLTAEGNDLINMVGNETLVKDVESRSEMFPIYREEFLRRMRMASDIRRRKDEHAMLLIECVPQLPWVALKKILDLVFQYDEND